MKSYKVTDPKGITVNGKHLEKGETVRLGRGAATNTFLHFKQVREVDEAKAEGSGKEEKAKAEADAAAKAKAAAEKGKGGDPAKAEAPAK